MSEKNANVAEAIEETAEKIAGVGTYTFKQPAKIDGEAVDTIDYDFTAMNGSNIRHAKSELQKRGYTVAVKELDECFHAAMFAEAAGVSIEDVERFGMKDYNAVADIARDFLFGED